MLIPIFITSLGFRFPGYMEMRVFACSDYAFHPKLNPNPLG